MLFMARMVEFTLGAPLDMGIRCGSHHSTPYGLRISHMHLILKMWLIAKFVSRKYQTDRRRWEKL